MNDTLVIVPTYNNAGTLPNVLERCRALGLPILVVDDGSTDATSAILENARCMVVRHSRNRGKGKALKTGFLQARKLGYSYAVTIDSDGQHFPEDIPALLAAKGERSLVVGSRPKRGGNGGGAFANRFSNFWFRLFTGVKLPDTQTGFRLYPLNALPSLSIMGARYEAELALLVFAAWKGLDLVPVPVQVAYPENRVSHFRPGADFLRISLLNTLLVLLALLYGWPRTLLRRLHRRSFSAKGAILKLYDFLSVRKGIAGLLLALLMALSAWSASRLHFEEDISAFLPDASREQLQDSGGEGKMAVFFRGGTPEERLEAFYAFQDRWEEAFPDIDLYEGADGEQVTRVFDFLSGNWPYFLLPEDYARMDSLLAVPGYIPARLQEDKASLATGNPFTSQYLRKDPLGLFSPVLGRLQNAQPSALQDTEILFFDSPNGGTESARNAELLRALRALREQTARDFPGVQITSTGGPEVAVENASRIKTDSFLALAIAFLLIALVLWMSYKRVADVLWILISIGVGAVFALGIIACFKASVSIIVLGIGCTVIGIAVNYPLHYIDHLKYRPNRREALAEQVNPLLTGNITTVGAFLGLLLLKSEALHDFGFIGAMMLVGTIVFVLVFLPVFAPVCKGERKVVKLDPARLFHPHRTVFLVFLALTVLFFFTGKKLRFDSNLHNINYMTREQADGFALLESLSPSPEAFPLPTFQEQQERIGLWKDFWNRHGDLADVLIDEGLKAGFTAHGFQPFFDALETDWQPQGRAYFRPVDFSPQENAAAALVSALSEDFNTIGLVCSLIVLLFLWISFGSLELTLIAFLPLAVSWIWIRGIMGLTGLQFNIVNIILATFIFGMGDDYSIFITEGLEYEYKTGKKILHSYSNAVVLSAVIMFIGIGVLAFAKHPALRSLGLVTVIGMVTVVAMACYLPPILYRRLHFKDEKRRPQPLTIGGMLATAYIALQMVVWMSLLSVLALFFPDGPAFGRVVRRVASWAIRAIPGCKYTLLNPHGEDFSRPAVYVCNHQSHLDVLALIALQPKLIFMTNDWVWKFPFYGTVIRKAGYFPASWGLSVNSRHVNKMVAEGYSVVIFPEGTRTADGSIGRFHRGAFLTARELGMDVLPLLIRGFHEALPKHDFFLRPHPLSLEIGERIQVPHEADIAAFTKLMRHKYVQWYEQDS